MAAKHAREPRAKGLIAVRAVRAVQPLVDCPLIDDAPYGSRCGGMQSRFDVPSEPLEHQGGRLALANCARTGEVAVPAETEYAKNGRGQGPSRYRDHYCPVGVRLKLREHSSHERDRGGHGGGDEASEHLSRDRPY